MGYSGKAFPVVNWGSGPRFANERSRASARNQKCQSLPAGAPASSHSLNASILMVEGFGFIKFLLLTFIFINTDDFQFPIDLKYAPLLELITLPGE